MRTTGEEEGRRETCNVGAQGHYADGDRAKNKGGRHGKMSPRSIAIREEGASQRAQEHTQLPH